MAGEHRHAFDLELCDYAVGQFRSHFRTLRERPRPPFPALDYDSFHRQTPAERLGRVVAGLPKPLADHIWSGVHGVPVMRSLTDDELNAFAIALAVSGGPAERRFERPAGIGPLTNKSGRTQKWIRSSLSKLNFHTVGIGPELIERPRAGSTGRPMMTP